MRVSAERTGMARLRELPKNVWAFTVTSFLTDISSEMLFNLLPIFLATVLGVRMAYIGLIEGIATSTASLVQLGSGRLSDRWGRRKPLAVFGYGLSTLAKPFLILANSWWGVMGVRFADRVGKGVRTPPRDALLSESVAKDTQGLAFGLHRAGDTAGAVLGILIAILMLRALQPDAAILQRGTFHAIVIASTIPAVLAVVAIAVGVSDTGKSDRSSTQGDLTGRWAVKELGRPFFSFIGVVALFTLANSSDAFLIIRANVEGLTPIGVLGMMLVFNVVYTLVSIPAGAISDRIGRRALLAIGWGVYGVTYLGFSFTSAPWQVWGLMGFYGIYAGSTEGVAKAFVADLTPQAHRGSAFGIYSAVVGLMVLPASLLAGLLWQGLGDWPGLGMQAPFILGASLAFLAAILLWRVPAVQVAPSREG